MTLEQAQQMGLLQHQYQKRRVDTHDPPEKLEETRAWMLNLLPKFKEVFDPRVENILRQLGGATGGDPGRGVQEDNPSA